MAKIQLSDTLTF